LQRDFIAGETVFPLATPEKRLPGTEEIDRPGMEDCAIGLAVIPTKANAVLFYNREGNMKVQYCCYYCNMKVEYCCYYCNMKVQYCC
jgi:hypothetical protein